MSGKSQFALLKTKRFLPLFVTQALSAFNDNVYRLALNMILVGSLSADVAGTLNNISSALYTLPFFLFSAFAGQLVDKLDKAYVARRLRFLEIFIAGIAAAALFSGNIAFQLFCIFLLGAQSAFFGPVKYGILPQHLQKDELIGGNGLVEMATFVAILLGVIFGSVAILLPGGKWTVGAVMLAVALLSFWTSTRIPPAPSVQPELRLNWNLVAETWNLLKMIRSRPDVFKAILGISWFWFLGVTITAQIILFTKDSLLASQDSVAPFIFAMFSIFIGVGSVFCNKLLGGKISARLVPVSAMLISVFLIDLYFAADSARSLAVAGTPTGLADMLTSVQGVRVFFDLAAIAFCAGLYVVPLFAIMQARTPHYLRARTVGANNVVNAIFMIVASGLSGILLAGGVSVNALFLILGLANVVASIYVIHLLPHEALSGLVRSIFRLLYRVEVKGLHNVTVRGRRSLIVANHTSFLDGPLLSAFLPERAGFAINTQMAKKWWVKPAFGLFDLCPIDPANPLALRSLVDMLRKGRKVVIFPEGRITTTGGLMKIYEGPAAVAQMARGHLVPVRIDGAHLTPFSRLAGKLPTLWFPKITITFLPPVDAKAPDGLRGSALREFQAEHLYDVMTDAQFKSAPVGQTLWRSLLDARKLHGPKTEIIEDIQRTPLSYDRVVIGAFILGRKIAALTPGEKNVGVLLPNASGTVVTFFALQATGRVPAMLNFSTGAVNMAAACMAAEVRTILTSRKFIAAGEMEAEVKLLSERCRIIYLDDVRESIGAVDKLRGLLAKSFALWSLRRGGATDDPDAPAAILFTSGSEGVPKGVVLSHRNLNANRLQAAARIAFTPRDIVFNALPVFHAFGLTGGMLLPLMAGIYTFMYPSPLHYKIVPELCYDTGATVLFGTDTFLAGYAKNAHPYDFHTMRLVVAGAERLKPETRQAWLDLFGLRILEGYGATECSPVVAVNTPMHFRAGTVGRLMDGMAYRLEPVPGIADGGRLHVKGPNVMLGYLRADNPGVLEAPPDGWYDTGDIVSVDSRRYITILGRAKRFCKIAGEMVSLNAIEQKLAELYPEQAHAVVAAPDKKKGEQLVLFTTLPKPDRKEISTGLKKLGLADLMIPKNIFEVDALPLLGSGKTDYVSINRMAREKVPD
jgi:acyl-[acyl-carrier-protein]-phospholipid O-acyltransferase / long-chain-fatty-acid--[acyl-carrier-protein] ligase